MLIGALCYHALDIREWGSNDTITPAKGPRPCIKLQYISISICQENGLEAKSDPSGKSVQKARWVFPALVPDGPSPGPRGSWSVQDRMGNKKCLLLRMQQDTGNFYCLLLLAWDMLCASLKFNVFDEFWNIKPRSLGSPETPHMFL